MESEGDVGAGQTPHVLPTDAESPCALGSLWLCPPWVGAAEGCGAGLGSPCALGGPVPLCDCWGRSSACLGRWGPKDTGCPQHSTPLVLSKGVGVRAGSLGAAPGPLRGQRAKEGAGRGALDLPAG